MWKGDLASHIWLIELYLGSRRVSSVSFIQISDIHISHLRDQERIHDLWKFATETLDTIKPPVVLASGDLTDGRGKQLYVSQQYDKEWESYNLVLTQANVTNKTIWLDIRGNHGMFKNFMRGKNLIMEKV